MYRLIDSLGLLIKALLDYLIDTFIHQLINLIDD